MDRSDLHQRLAAILAADAAGYSRLMALDEAGTVAALDSARAAFRTAVAAHHGRVVDTAGDSVLAVFETAAGAVNAALAVQQQLVAQAAPQPNERRMRFRIGVHLGDVIEKDDGTIYGDGVNVAARLQAFAEPGGIAVSGIVNEAVHGRVSTPFEDLGEHAFKNITRPVHVFRVDFGAGSDIAAAARRLVPATRRRRRVAAMGALLLAAGIAAWIAGADSARRAHAWLGAHFGSAPAQSVARASIAVLPFTNLSGDARRDYFSDGITEDIIHALGRFSGVMVMSRNAVQPYKGRLATPAEIGRELDVRYIVQGSVREAGGLLRVAVELSSAQNGSQLWSERYEGAGAQVFEIQDRIVGSIVGALAVQLTQVEQQRVFAKPTASLEAYDLVLRARSLLEQEARGPNREARALLERASSVSPEYAEISTALCEAEFQRAVLGWVEDAQQAVERAQQLCKHTLASPDQQAHARAHALLGYIYSHLGRFDDALSHSESAIELNPSDATALSRRGAALLYVGRIDEAIAVMEAAKRVDPRPSASPAHYLAVAYYVTGRYREALERIDALLARTPDHVSLNALRAATLAQLGNAEEARQAADRLRRLNPTFEVETFGATFQNKEFTALLQDGLRKAGL